MTLILLIHTKQWNVCLFRGWPRKSKPLLNYR